MVFIQSKFVFMNYSDSIAEITNCVTSKKSGLLKRNKSRIERFTKNILDQQPFYSTILFELNYEVEIKTMVFH